MFAGYGWSLLQQFKLREPWQENGGKKMKATVSSDCPQC